MCIIELFDELKGLIGQEVVVSDWIDIMQQQVNFFVEVMGDYQWIYVDVECVKCELLFGVLVVYGFFMLLFLFMLMVNVIEMLDVKMGVNYGLNKVCFIVFVLVGSCVCVCVKLVEMEVLLLLFNVFMLMGVQMIWVVIIECEGQDCLVCVVELIFCCYF